MATAYNYRSKNVSLTWVYITLFLVFVIGVGYVFSAAMNNSSILYGAVLFSTLMSFGSYWWSDKIVLSMSDARPVTHEEAPELYNIVENLAITAGLPAPRVYIINDPAMNAFATGRDPEHGVICFTSGIVQALNRTELEGVAAHELSHIGNRDTLLSTVVVILVGFIALLADWFRNFSFFGGRDSEDRRSNGIFLIIGIVLSILAPLAATLIQLAISRRREFLADASGALLTRYPDGLASALSKLESDPRPTAEANTVTAHLYITNPFKGRRLANLFMTHPPIEERIAALKKMDMGS